MYDQTWHYKLSIGWWSPYTRDSFSQLTVTRSHWEMFPHNREVPASLAQELTGILIHAGIGM